MYQIIQLIPIQGNIFLFILIIVAMSFSIKKTHAMENTFGVSNGDAIIVITI